MFVDADGPNGSIGDPDDDCRLAAGSPLIDAGSNAEIGLDIGDYDDDGQWIDLVAWDLAGAPRRVDRPASPDAPGSVAPVVDFGAFELPPPCGLPGDTEPDGDVDLTDLAMLLANFGAAGQSQQTGDVNGDGSVDLTDLSLLLANFGASCP